MLKTNSKETRRRIREWIINNFDFSNYEGYEKEPKSEDEILEFIGFICCKELGFQVTKLKVTPRKMFYDWCRGLPSLIDTASFLCGGSAVDLVGDILEQTKEERSKYTEWQSEDLMLSLIYREVQEFILRNCYCY